MGQLDAYSFLQPEHSVKLHVWEKSPQIDLGMGTPDPVDPPVTLDKAHRIPRQIEVDDVAALLEVHPFGKHICRDQKVEDVFGPWRRSGGHGCKAIVAAECAQAGLLGGREP